MSQQIGKRKVEQEDLHFIYSTWLKSLYFGNSWFRQIDKVIFFKKYARIIDDLIRCSTVEVACFTDQPDIIVGYIVYFGPTMHWVYVKKSWRMLGVANMLIPQKISTISHLTKLGKVIRKEEWKFDPFLF